MIDYAAILTANYPNDIWTLEGDTYEGITWLSESKKPTKAQLDAQWPKVDYDNQCVIVSNTRHKEYIVSSDPIFFQYQREENTKQAWEDAVKAIQDANPYPPSPTS